MRKTDLIQSFFFCWCILMMASCADHELIDTNEIRQTITLSGVIDNMATPRVANERFCDGDVMGVYIVDYIGGKPGNLENKHNRATNVPHTYDQEKHQWKSAYDIYWKDNKTNIDVYGYYPYGTPSEVNAYSFYISNDQSIPSKDGKMGGYEASDFLWGKAEDVSPTKKTIRLPLRHHMSKVLVKLAEGSGFEPGEWEKALKQVLIMNTKQQAQIDLATGTVTPIGEVNQRNIIPLPHDQEFHAIVVPQTIPSQTKLFSITIDGISYYFRKKQNFTYQSGKLHRFTIQVDKKLSDKGFEFSLKSESIESWEPDFMVNESDAKEYIVVHVEKPGTLSAALKAAQKDCSKVKNMKLTGTISPEDFYFMRDSMPELKSLNLKEVSIKGKRCGNSHEQFFQEYQEDEIPYQAFGKEQESVKLTRIILPDKLKTIGQEAFKNCKYLSGSLIIPEGVEEIGSDAFAQCSSLTGMLYLPSTLKTIGILRGYDYTVFGTFSGCKFVCELQIPDKVEYISAHSFNYCTGLYGELHLPSQLKQIHASTFNGCHNLTGSLTIPTNVTSISEFAFYNCGFNGSLTLHNGIKEIGQYAFSRVSFKGELILPESLETIEKGTFSYCKFGGQLKLPKNLMFIREEAFSYNNRLSGVIEIPEGVTSLYGAIFNGCTNLEGVIFHKNFESLQGLEEAYSSTGPFCQCPNIRKIVCKSPYPPMIDGPVFKDVPKNDFFVEVPEGTVQQYRSAKGWREFKRFAAHHHLSCQPSSMELIHNSKEVEVKLQAEGDWEIISKPDWCNPLQMSGNKDATVKIQIEEYDCFPGPREGEIIFKLKGLDYIATCKIRQYNADSFSEGVVTILQQASAGIDKGINLIFLGEGFNGFDITCENYKQRIEEQVEHFFAIEPYRTYRDYFNVYMLNACSPESGIGTSNAPRYNRFNTVYEKGKGFHCDYDKLLNYVLKHPIVTREKLKETLIVLTLNTKEYSGNCHLWEDGSAIAFCPFSEDKYPYDTRGIVQQVAGGMGFGKLGPENITHNIPIQYCGCTCCPHMQEFKLAKSLGWYENLSSQGKSHEVPWSHFIKDKRYNNYVDVFDGGFFHSKGIFRSETNSCMNDNVDYFNAISRESIVKRIKRYAGETYSFEDFVKNDKENQTGNIQAARSISRSRQARHPQYPPQIHRGSPLK